MFFFFQAEDGIRDFCLSRGLGDVYKRQNLVFGVNSIKTYCDNLGKLIQNYDDIVELEHELMGLDKWGRRPKNHMFARVTKDGLFADGWGAGWYEGCMNELASTTKSLREGVWAIAHEFGHVNQIRPGLKWVSTTEVTNNVYSVSYTHLRAHETGRNLVCRLLLEKKKLRKQS